MTAGTGIQQVIFSKAPFCAVFVFAAVMFGCKPKCYDCVVTNSSTMEKDTINFICSDDPQYTSAYLQSWRVACEIAGGETYLREGE